MPPGQEKDDFQSLRAAIANVSALLHTLQASISRLPRSQSSDENTHVTVPHLPSNPDLDPLALLTDASKLVEAQTIKLSLLVLNEPFSPREIVHILTRLSNECLPALASCVELLPAEKYTLCLALYVRNGVGRVWTELARLIGEIPTTKEDVDKLHSLGGSQGNAAKGTLLSTGLLWDSCKKLIRLSDRGTSHAGMIACLQEVQSNMQLVEDAIGELEAWDPDDEDDDDDEEFSSSEDGSQASQKKVVVRTPTTSEDEDATSAGGTVTTAMQKLQINPLANLKVKALKHLKLIRMLCEALSKRRVSTFPPFTVSAASATSLGPSAQQILQIDALVGHAKYFTEEVDEIVGTLYASDMELFQARLKELATRAEKCVGELRLSWDGRPDVFTYWSDKWVVRLREIGGQTGGGSEK